MTLFERGLLILQTRGEDEARMWYKDLSDAERAQFDGEVRRAAAATVQAFAPVMEAAQRAQASLLDALRPVMEEWARLQKGR